jgi:hypothetical protein
MRGGLCTFVHIPKTGGTTLQNILSRFYSKDQSLHVSSVKTSIREIAQTRASQTPPFLIKGHLNIAEVTDIPNNYIFTFLRPPISRVISHYYFLKEQPTVKHYKYLNDPDTTIESYYALKEKKDIDNCMVRYLGGLHSTEFGKIGQKELDAAIHNLHHKIDFVGFQAHYDESLIMLSRELNWSLPIYRKKNITAKKEIVSASTMEFLQDANKWDILLFEEAKRIFSDKMNKMSAEDKKRLSRMRFLNKLAALYPF